MTSRCGSGSRASATCDLLAGHAEPRLVLDGRLRVGGSPARRRAAPSGAAPPASRCRLLCDGSSSRSTSRAGPVTNRTSWPASTRPGTRSAPRRPPGPGRGRCAAPASTPPHRTCRTGGRTPRGHRGLRAPGGRDRTDAPSVLPCCSGSGVIRAGSVTGSPDRRRGRGWSPPGATAAARGGRAPATGTIARRSRRINSILPAVRRVWKPKSRRKSAGKIVRWRTNRSGKPASGPYRYANASSAGRPRSRHSPIAARIRLWSAHGLPASIR